jgi:hypothetical protein
MKRLKKWNEISADELEYRQILQETYHVNPVKKAVGALRETLDKVYTLLGVNIKKSDDSIEMQREILGIHMVSYDKEQAPKAAGIYVLTEEPTLCRYYIPEPEVDSHGEFSFRILDMCDGAEPKEVWATSKLKVGV